eukprot:TRINITY_DN1561_c0_g1_i21.p1 TRINITY_DN1561_c0_g1~~TRINITY_DN1561_c0_g1_i21.p1  ORF type:complete len:157 (-),score=34.71 TRINITY_DN1561_c0_g1_i21:52-522(-)
MEPPNPNPSVIPSPRSSSSNLEDTEKKLPPPIMDPNPKPSSSSSPSSPSSCPHHAGSFTTAGWSSATMCTGRSSWSGGACGSSSAMHHPSHATITTHEVRILRSPYSALIPCLLYTSDAADEEDSVDLGGRRIIKKKKKIMENGREQNERQDGGGR